MGRMLHKRTIILIGSCVLVLATLWILACNILLMDWRMSSLSLSVIQSIRSDIDKDLDKTRIDSDTRYCKPAVNLAYVKTHKTGSTTLAVIIDRFGYEKGLSFLFYKINSMRGHFRQLNIETELLLPPRCVREGDYRRYRGYNMMTGHFRLLPNLDQLRKVMAPGSKVITILREPRAQFESAFSHFGAGSAMGLHPVESNSTLSEDLARFLTDPEFYWNRASGHARWYTRNGQLFDLGDTRAGFIRDGKIDELNQTIHMLDNILDLVLITEHFDESLILLKRLMCWSFRDILYVKQNERSDKFRSELTEDQELRLRRWNMADTVLYDHFNQSLRNKVAAYGADFQSDLAAFRMLLDTYQHACINGTQVRLNNKRTNPVAANNSTFCQRLVDGFQTQKLIIDRQRVFEPC